MERVTVRAFAKVNMRLEIKEKRPDGYHGIETLFRGIFLYDTVVLSKAKDGVALSCEGPAAKDLPEDNRNLAWQAADMLRNAFPDRIGGIRIRLYKRIPLNAGLGGGSADAAAVLTGIDRLFALDLGMEVLTDFAAKLGSDVAFCLQPLAAVGCGRGEKLRPANPGPSLWIVLVKPTFGMSTKAVYDNWDYLRATQEMEPNGADASLALLLEGLRDNKPEHIWANMDNDLEKPAFLMEKRLSTYKQWIEEELARIDVRCGKVMLCGSGSTLAVYFPDEGSARQLAERLRVARRLGIGWDSGLPLILLAKTLDETDLNDRVYG